MIEVGSDVNESLFAWKERIEQLILEYGGYSTLRTDGGYNNVSLELTPVPSELEGGRVIQLTPTGTPIYIFEKFIPVVFDDKDMGDRVLREDFVGAEQEDQTFWYDGHVGEILIDGKLTCYGLGNEWLPFRTWTVKGDTKFCYEPITLRWEEFLALEGKVEVVFYSK